MTARRPRRRRGVLIAVAAALAVALAAWVVLCVDVLVNPEVDEVVPVDAAYVLGPVETRIEDTRAVLDRGVAPVLLATLSVDEDTGEAYATDHCGTRTELYEVRCVLPDPYTTQGEARTLAAEVQEHGWERVAVLTSTPHAARARMLMERCTDAEVLVWTVGDEPDGLGDWAKAFVYQSAAWVKTQLVRDC